MAQWAINQRIIDMEYAVRGKIPARATELQKAGRRAIFCNVGNPQALGQKPLSFHQQVFSLLSNPGLLDEASSAVPSLDAYTCQYARVLLEAFEGFGLGAYTDSRGPLKIREAVSAFINARDGVSSDSKLASDPDSIFLTNGASEAATAVLELLIGAPSDGVMIPIPQYPLYSASLERLGGTQVPYLLDEDAGWSFRVETLEESVREARKQGVTVKAIVIINPNNPTGTVTLEKELSDVVDFAERNGLGIIADEVYQANTYGAPFTSLAKAVGDRNVPVFSLHSTSKGFVGACGHRGGYVEVRNAPQVQGCSSGFLDLLLKRFSVNLCSNTLGQATVRMMVCPPEEGSPPFELYETERQHTLGELHAKAGMMRGAFEKMEGVTCAGSIGAMYLFPRLGKLPHGTTDFDYCWALLEKTGLCTVNGGGFGQAPGTHHLRVAFLPPRQELERVLPEWVEWHNQYVDS